MDELRAPLGYVRSYLANTQDSPSTFAGAHAQGPDEGTSEPAQSGYWYDTKSGTGLTCSTVCCGVSIGRSSSSKFFQPR